MGNRYWISGTQLGIIRLFVKEKTPHLQKHVVAILQNIKDKQYIGDK